MGRINGDDQAPAGAVLYDYFVEQRKKQIREAAERIKKQVGSEVRAQLAELDRKAEEKRRQQNARETRRKRTRAVIELWTGFLLALVVALGFGAGVAEFVRTVLAW